MTVHHVAAGSLISVVVELLECSEQEVADSLLEDAGDSFQDDGSAALEDAAQVLPPRLARRRTMRSMRSHVDADRRHHASLAPEMSRLQGLAVRDQVVEVV